MSCKAKFKKSEWNYDLGILDENRLEMAEDLRNNYFHKGMSVSEIKKLIGKPNYIKNDTISYLIYEDYGWNIDPEKTYYLNIKISKDSSYINSFIQKIIHK